MIDSKGGAFGFDCCLASPKFRVFQQPASGSLRTVQSPVLGGACFFARKATTPALPRHRGPRRMREETTRAGVEHQRHPVAILNIGGMHRHAQQQAERIDEDIALATRDLLARIEALRVERGPPFCAPLAL